MYVRQYVDGHPRMGRVYSTVSRQPGWIWKTAALAGLAVLAVPLMLLALAAALTAGVAFAVLAGVHRLGRWAGGTVQRPDGRRNVRVVRREAYHYR